MEIPRCACAHTQPSGKRFLGRGAGPITFAECHIKTN